MKLFYNLGDKVKITEDKFGKGYFINATGTIVDIRASQGNTWYVVKFEHEYAKDRDELPFLFVELEKTQ